MKLRIVTPFLVFFLSFYPAIAQAEDEHNPDPWESMNRNIFQFNEGADEYVLKPIAEGYVAGIPEQIRQLFTTFFETSNALADGINFILQGEPVRGSRQLARFVINCTLGMLCMVDVSGSFGIPVDQTNLGTTLGIWGVGDGPYLVVPLLGPSTVRDAAMIYPQSLLWAGNLIDDEGVRLVLRAGMIIDKRAHLLKAEDLIIGDKYSFIREAYLQSRHFAITGEELEDDF